MRRDGRLGFWKGLRAIIAYLWTWARGGHYIIPLALALTVGATGCAGTLHYGTYAEATQKAYESRMKSRSVIVDRLASAMQSNNEQTRMAGAMALAFFLSRDPSFRLEAPRDNIAQALSIIAPVVGMWGIADTVGRHMSGHGGTNITNGDGSLFAYGDNSTAKTQTNTFTNNGDQNLIGKTDGDGTFNSYPERDTGNTNN